MSIYDIPLTTLDGHPTTLAEHKGEVLLLVNVASRCGMTPQYTALEDMQRTYGDRGFTVLGFPCNQFGGQEPGTAAEIQEFCSTTYGVSFPLYEKLDVNGDNRHPLYEELVATPDNNGLAGDVSWNFEKFIVAADGTVTHRFRSKVKPQDPAVISAVEAALPD